LLRLGFFVLLCCVFAGLRLIAQRRLTEPFTWTDDHTLPHHGVPLCVTANLAAHVGVGSRAASEQHSLSPLCPPKRKSEASFVTSELCQ
jgi:hypothetical protein